jgi:cytochrome c oxidase subunit II
VLLWGGEFVVFHWLTQPITDLGHQTDTLFYWVLGLTGVVFVLVEVLLVWYLLRYKRTHAEQQGLDYHGNTKLEIIWTLIPALILVGLGAYSLPIVKAQQAAPTDSYVIEVTGHMWSWEFKYPNGLDTVNSEDLRIPANKNVVFKITSADVIHDFWVPQFRVKQDALPGRLTQVWVNVKQDFVGNSYPIECAEYCGTFHSKMISKVEILSQSDFDSWSASALQTQVAKQKADAEAAKKAAANGGDAKAGETVAQKSCLACHAIDGTTKSVGPNWKGIYGTTVKLSNGSSVKIDDAYLTESIKNPSAKVVNGYSAMPQIAGISDADIANLVAYIKTLK